MFRVSWGGLHAAWEQVPPPRLGHAASKTLQPYLASHQKGFPNGQNPTFWVGKKKVTRTKPPILNLFWYFRGKINYLFSYEGIFLSVVWFPMARCCRGQNQNTVYFYWDKTPCSCCKAFLPAVSFHRKCLNFRVKSILKWKTWKTQKQSFVPNKAVLLSVLLAAVSDLCTTALPSLGWDCCLGQRCHPLCPSPGLAISAWHGVTLSACFSHNHESFLSSFSLPERSRCFFMCSL